MMWIYDVNCVDVPKYFSVPQTKHAPHPPGGGEGAKNKNCFDDLFYKTRFCGVVHVSASFIGKKPRTVRIDSGARLRASKWIIFG